MAYTAWSVIAGEVPTAAKWNLLGANDAQFNTDITKLLAAKVLNTVADASTVTFDMSVSSLHMVTLGGNRQFALASVPIGTAFVVIVKQDTTGGRVPTWWSGIKWPGGSPPTLSTAPDAIDVFGFINIAENSYLGLFMGFGL